MRPIKKYTLKLGAGKENNLEKDSVALVFQIQSLDARRLIKKIGNLSKKQVGDLMKILHNYIN